jgi:hypothetical protein
MNVILAILVWVIMATILVTGVVLAVKGSFWLLILGFVAFVLGIAKVGCLSH